MNRNNTYTVTSLFCGLGGFDLGFEWAGYDIIWANDILENAISTYKINFGRSALCQDITQLPFEDIPTADVIIGGPPCQSFSLMGKREADDPRGQLVFHFFEVIKHKRPRAFVMENVPGMAASKINNISVPEILKTSFIKLGYQVNLIKIVATDYLVPQRRQRLILMGCLDALPPVPDKLKFAQECYGIDALKYDNSASAAIGDLGSCVSDGERTTYNFSSPSQFAKIMRQANLENVSLHICPRMSTTDQKIVHYIPPGGNYMDIPDAIAPGRVLKYKQTGGRTTTYGRLHPEQPTYTINTYFRRPNVGQNFHYAEPRLITPREAMRFQAIPDHFEINYSSQDGRNALIGNAVPPLVSQALGWSLKKTLNGEYTFGTTASTQLSFFDDFSIDT